MAALFRITAAAKYLILRQLAGSSAKFPVVLLVHAVIRDSLPPEITEALEAGVDNSVLRELERKHRPDNFHEMMRLYPAIYSRWRFLPWELVTVDEFTFCLPWNVRRQVRNGVLDIADKGLKLQDESGNTILPKGVLSA